MPEVDPRIVQVVGELFGIEAADMSPDAGLESDLQLDSLSVVELQVALEDELGVRLAPEDPSSVRTVADLQRVVSDALANPEPAMPSLNFREQA